MQFLLERLAYPPLSLDGHAAPFNMKAAVAAQIQRIVSARVVESDGEPDLLEFGIPNVIELAMSSKGQLERYGARLGRLISRYEPRLSKPRVHVEPTRDPLMPYRLVVSGSLLSTGEPELFYFVLPRH
jgi:predicted component of type VI protein secretion system